MFRVLVIGEVKTNTFSAEAREQVKRNKVDLFSQVYAKILANLELLIHFNNANVNDDDVQRKIREEIELYFKRGSCRLENGQSIVCVNPTMLNPLNHKWELYPTLSPFDGYLPMSDEELSLKSANNPILIHACQKILKRLVSSYRSRLNSIQVVFHLGDALEYCYAEKNIKFDVVYCSNLADYFGFPNLLIASVELLANHPEAVLWTDIEFWSDFNFSMENCIESTLCCPISMIPSIYGVRLGNHLKLGSSSQNILAKSRRLFWKRAQRVENVAFHPSPVLTRCLDQLAKKCFVLKFPKSVADSEMNNHLLSIISYTPLTFYYIVGSMTQRLGGDRWLKDIPHLTKIPPALKLAKRTLDAWKSGQPILKMTFQVEWKDALIYDGKHRNGAPPVRVVLYPKSRHLNRSAKLIPRMKQPMAPETMYMESFRNILSLPNVHMIDNFHFEVKHSSEEYNATISFFLVPDHGLEKTHNVLLHDIVNDIPAYVFDSVDSMEKETCRIPFPSFDSFKAKLAAPGFQERKVKMDTCIETEDKYFLQFSVASKEDMSGKVFGLIFEVCLF